MSGKPSDGLKCRAPETERKVSSYKMSGMPLVTIQSCHPASRNGRLVPWKGRVCYGSEIYFIRCTASPFLKNSKYRQNVDFCSTISLASSNSPPNVAHPLLAGLLTGYLLRSLVAAVSSKPSFSSHDSQSYPPSPSPAEDDYLALKYVPPLAPRVPVTDGQG